MGRREARETAFKLVFERCVSKEDNEITYDMMTATASEDETSYISRLYRGVSEKNQILLDAIGGYAKAFDIERIFKIDLSILLIASYELLYCDDIPAEVAVNEAIELAKKYSTDKSSSFINGVLATVLKNKEVLLESENN